MQTLSSKDANDPRHIRQQKSPAAAQWLQGAFNLGYMRRRVIGVARMFSFSVRVATDDFSARGSRQRVPAREID